MQDAQIEKAVAGILGGYTDPIPTQLLHALKSGNCVLLAGAGVSRRCLSRNRKPLPTWQELLTGLISWSANKEMIPNETIEDFKKLIERGEYLIVAEEFIETYGKQTIHNYLEDVFDPDGIVPSQLHKLLVATPFRYFVTTNYDNLLERAFMNTRNRNIERVSVDELNRIDTLLGNSDFVIKLHGDLDKPETIILGQRKYQDLYQSSEYSSILERIFFENSVLMVGYGLKDTDILLALDRLARVSPEQPPHFMLCPRGSRTLIEKKRLASDRNIHVIEYVDYFGFHNHIDTFLRGLNAGLNNIELLNRVPRSLGARIYVHYSAELEADGLFVWNFLFREGAITLSEEPQKDQLRHLDQNLDDGLQALDYLLFVVNENSLDAESTFLSKIKRAIQIGPKAGVQLLFLVVSVSKRPLYISDNVFFPTFYVDHDFSEKDLSLLYTYIAQDTLMGHRQP